MNPFDTTFSHLSCLALTHIRYDYLKFTSSSPLNSKPKYFFALNFYNYASLFSYLLNIIIEIIIFLRLSNCVLFIIEGRFHDNIYEILHFLTLLFAVLNLIYIFTTNGINPKAGANIDHIETFATLRNQALYPLIFFTNSFDFDTIILFINDIALCIKDILKLIYQRHLQQADITYAMDWIYNGSIFYNV